MDQDEEMSNVVAYFWKRATRGQLKSLYYNIVQILIEALEGIKPIGVSQFTRGVDGKVDFYVPRL